MNTTTNFEMRRLMAAASANQEDAHLWRMFSQLYEERRIRWCNSADGWLVSIDHRHLATEATFDQAIRHAIGRFDNEGKKLLKKRFQKGFVEAANPSATC